MHRWCFWIWGIELWTRMCCCRTCPESSGFTGFPFFFSIPKVINKLWRWRVSPPARERKTWMLLVSGIIACFDSFLTFDAYSISFKQERFGFPGPCVRRMICQIYGSWLPYQPDFTWGELRICPKLRTTNLTTKKNHWHQSCLNPTSLSHHWYLWFSRGLNNEHGICRFPKYK